MSSPFDMIFKKDNYNYCEAIEEILKNYYVIAWMENTDTYIFTVGNADINEPRKKKIKNI